MPRNLDYKCRSRIPSLKSHRWSTSFPRAQEQDRAAAAGGQPLPDRAGEEQDGGREGQAGDRLHQERGG